MNRLAGKVAIVTGAGSGIGQGIAKRLGCEGAKVIVDYIGDPAGAKETQRAIQEGGGSGEIFQADITDLGQDRQLVDEAWNRFGAADILVNNAGMEHRSDFWDTTEEEYDKIMSVNLRGPFFLTQAFVRRLRDQKKPGRIINISSVHEELTMPTNAPYCAAKGGLKMLMRTIAVELAPYHITVNNVCPGAIDTKMDAKLKADRKKYERLLDEIPLHRMGKPDEIASMCAYLASDEASYITGASFVVDGGMTKKSGSL